MAKTVCIDAGHYGKYNKCPNNSNYYESLVMWKLHILQKKYLEQLGINVITTRADQTKDLDLTARGKKSKGCDLFISDHTNAVGSGMNEFVDYVAIYCLTDDTTTKCDDISKEFANKIAPVIATVMETKQNYQIQTRKASGDRNGDGMLNDNYYGVLHGCRTVNVPGVILEHSFHTNSRSVNWLLNDNNLDKLARVEAECIASYLLGKKVTLSTKMYKVQVGAFSIKTNALKLQAELKAKGFDTYLVEVDGIYKVQVGAYSIKANAEATMKKLNLAGHEAFITYQE